jgi:hypothetical protein
MCRGDDDPVQSKWSSVDAYLQAYAAAPLDRRVLVWLRGGAVGCSGRKRAHAATGRERRPCAPCVDLVQIAGANCLAYRAPRLSGRSHSEICTLMPIMWVIFRSFRHPDGWRVEEEGSPCDDDGACPGQSISGSGWWFVGAGRGEAG